MSPDEWEMGDYILGEIEKVDHDEFGYIGKDNQVRIVGEVSEGERILASITDTQAVGVVAEPVSEINSDSATVWVHHTIDINSRDSDSIQSSTTFDQMAGDEVADELSDLRATSAYKNQTGKSARFSYMFGAIVGSLIMIITIGYIIHIVFPPEGLIEAFVFSIGLYIAAPVLWLCLLLIVTGVIGVIIALKSGLRDQE